MKYEFASPEWFAALHAATVCSAAARFAQSPDYKISISEILVNVPPERGGTNGQIAWTIISDGPNVSFEFEERDDVDTKLKADYAFVLAASRLDSDDPAQAAELAKLGAEAWRTGKLMFLRGQPGAPKGASVHNLMARLTA